MFNLPHIERNGDFSYSKTFLNNVFFRIVFPNSNFQHFAESEIFQKLKEKYAEQKDNFQFLVMFQPDNTLKTTQETPKKPDGFEFTNAEKTVSLVVSKHNIDYIFAGNFYKNFAFFENFAKNELHEILQTLEVPKIQQTLIVKNNTAQYATSPEIAEQSAFSILSTLLNPALLADYTETPFLPFLHEFNNALFLKEKEQTLRIIYGLTSLQPNLYQLKLDFTAVSTEAYKDINFVFDKFRELNNYVFDAFQWATTDEYKNYLL